MNLAGGGFRTGKVAGAPFKLSFAVEAGQQHAVDDEGQDAQHDSPDDDCVNRRRDEADCGILLQKHPHRRDDEGGGEIGDQDRKPQPGRNAPERAWRVHRVEARVGDQAGQGLAIDDRDRGQHQAGHSDRENESEPVAGRLKAKGVHPAADGHQGNGDAARGHQAAVKRVGLFGRKRQHSPAGKPGGEDRTQHDAQHQEGQGAFQPDQHRDAGGGVSGHEDKGHRDGRRHEGRDGKQHDRTARDEKDDPLRARARAIRPAVVQKTGKEPAFAKHQRHGAGCECAGENEDAAPDPVERASGGMRGQDLHCPGVELRQ